MEMFLWGIYGTITCAVGQTNYSNNDFPVYLLDYNDYIKSKI
jgi:uncharacterized protein with PQ loop repeat